MVPGTNRSIEKEEHGEVYVLHTCARIDGICGIAIANKDYPYRVAFGMTTKVVGEFCEQFPDVRSVTSSDETPFPKLSKYLEQYKQPEKADPILKMRRDLVDTKEQLHDTVETLLERGEKIETVVLQADSLQVHFLTFSLSFFIRVFRGCSSTRKTSSANLLSANTRGLGGQNHASLFHRIVKKRAVVPDKSISDKIRTSTFCTVIAILCMVLQLMTNTSLENSVVMRGNETRCATIHGTFGGTENTFILTVKGRTCTFKHPSQVFDPGSDQNWSSSKIVLGADIPSFVGFVALVIYLISSSLGLGFGIAMHKRPDFKQIFATLAALLHLCGIGCYGAGEYLFDCFYLIW